MDFIRDMRPKISNLSQSFLLPIRLLPSVPPPLPSVADPAAGGAEKHEIYADAIGGHLFYDLFLQGRATPDPLLTFLFPIPFFKNTTCQVRYGHLPIDKF